MEVPNFIKSGSYILSVVRTGGRRSDLNRPTTLAQKLLIMQFLLQEINPLIKTNETPSGNFYCKSHATDISSLHSVGKTQRF